MLFMETKKSFYHNCEYLHLVHKMQKEMSKYEENYGYYVIAIC